MGGDLEGVELSSGQHSIQDFQARPTDGPYFTACQFVILAATTRAGLRLDAHHGTSINALLDVIALVADEFPALDTETELATAADFGAGGGHLKEYPKNISSVGHF